MGAIRRGKPWDAKKAPKPKADSKPAPARPPARPSSHKWKRYFENKKGGSNKFWEVTRELGKLTTRYGKIGTPGQTTVKTWSVPIEAEFEGERLIKEKKKKGYVEKK